VLPRGGIAVDIRETKTPFAGIAAGAAMQGGIEVLQVTPGSLAAEVGLLPGDVLLRLGDVATTSPQTFGVTFRARYRSAEGQPIEVAFRRAGQELTRRAAVQMRVARTYRLTRDANAAPQARAVLAGMLGQP
jgi:S1-C subfamily serine protease